MPLLSDQHSRLISPLGLLNERIAEQDAADGVEHDPNEVGAAHPGIFVLDSGGRVTERKFHRHYRIRPTGRTLLEDLDITGGTPDHHRSKAQQPEVNVEAWTSDTRYEKSQLLHVQVALRPRDNTHVYAPGAAAPLTGLEVNIEGPQELRVDPPRFPDPETIDDPFLDGPTPAYTTQTEVLVPIAIMEDIGNVEITTQLRYQACTPDLCHPPKAVELALPINGPSDV